LLLNNCIIFIAATAGKCLFEKDKQYAGAGQFDGLLPHGKVAMFDVADRATGAFFVPSLIDLVFPAASSAGVRVHSNSWGCRGITSYTHKALEVDEYMYDHPEFLVVAAAGNDGMLGMDSVGSPGASKNALTIGASAQNHNDLIYFSGRGKSFAGIIKPDVIGPGTGLYAAGVGTDGVEAQSCNKQISSGTSMATPMIAGASVLVQQYFEGGHWAKFCNKTYDACKHGVVPKSVRNANGDKNFVSSSLIKAVMINSAQNMQSYLSKVITNLGPKVSATNLTAPPDRYQGWGQVVLNSVMQSEEQSSLSLYLEDYATTKSFMQKTYYVVVTKENSDLRVTVTWNDPPNVLWAAKNLLNNIDLEVVGPDGVSYFGNNIRSDEFNPVERVVVEHAKVGVYVVTTTSKQFGFGSEQRYALVMNMHGYVDVARTTHLPIDPSKVVYDEATTSCDATGGLLVRMQFEVTYLCTTILCG
jgi:hypothetical protein